MSHEMKGSGSFQVRGKKPAQVRKRNKKIGGTFLKGELTQLKTKLFTFYR